MALNTVFNEAEASIMLQKANEAPLKGTDVGDYIKRITNEWFNARRAIGIEPYGKEDLVTEIKKLR